MNEKHLGKGSTNPPLSKGKLRLYSMRFCPYAQRAHLVLDAKKIPHDVVNIKLSDKPDWYFERNPLGKVPAIEMESGDCIYESLIIADYLDEKYPQRLLHPKDPIQKAKDRILVEHFSKIPTNVYKLFHGSDIDPLDDILTDLDLFEKELTLRATRFFGGDVPGMLDYVIWPWFERIDAFKIVAPEKFVIPSERYKKLNGKKQ
ncbi:pyrimidodiazepine synthase-like isoform X2 [Zootermopsis nevadensis]|uniref:pyrimidodiazepine synthase-like isoform X2 n=1 Tax=Zootermopsis nevadensis TaxID=136037 RepID=UPI000B8E62BD|nr:pyrimidodiazepine synthase-like isoform X2 [Zootermopsis nevadensis]